MQQCSNTACAVELNEDTGYRKTPEKFQSLCRACFNVYCVERWKETKRRAIEYLGGKCKCCGYDKCMEALEFHHRNPKEKDVNWTKLRLRSWDKIRAELDKCDCLCANCHRETHYYLAP